jgi:Tfp pilus assembly protein PilN
MKAVNLLPPDQRGASKATAVSVANQPGGNGAYAVLGALAIGVVAVAGYVLTNNTIKEREAKLEGLAAREQAAMAKVGNLKPYADFAALANTRVATVKDLAGRRFDWENALRDLSRAIPANVTLNSLDGTVSTENGGTGGSGLRSSINAPAITITGCTDNQRDVATLMARLRTVDGVTRVSLSKSSKTDVAKPEPTTGVTGPTVSANGDAPTCKPGSPPEFEMVMFFERATDASAAPTGPAGSATPTAATQAGTAASTASATPSTPATGTTTTPATGTQSSPTSSGTATPASTTTSTGATDR